jgi:DNA-directed RNA polymerase specialized sigma24 family protein
MINYIAEYNDMVNTLATEYSRKYAMIERDDIAQELWVWFVGHPRKYKEWSELERKDMDKLIAKSLRNAALKFCEREKASKIGYDITDLYYYNVAVVEVFLPNIIAESYEIPTKIKDLGDSVKSSEISDGMNWLVLRSDIASAYYRLPEAKQNVLRLRFSVEQPDWAEIAKDMGSTPDGARMKVQRAINSLIKNLSGWKPYNDEESQEASGETTDSVSSNADQQEAD